MGDIVRILNVVVVEKNNDIEVIFDCSKDWEERSYYFGEDSYHLPYIHKLNKRAPKGESQESIVDDYNITQSWEKSFKITRERGEYEFSNSKLSFILPRNRSCALKLMNALSQYYSEQMVAHPARFNHILIGAPVVQENMVIQKKRILNKSKLNLFGLLDKVVEVKHFSAKMNEYLTFSLKNEDTFFQALVDELLKFEQLPGYGEAMDVVKSYSNKAKTTEECEKTASLKLNVLVHVATDLIQKNQQKELNSLLKQMNDGAKDELYAPCLGQIADDNKKYSDNYSEYKLLKSGDFRIREDGRMSLLLINNPEYKRLYAPGKKLQNTLEREMRHLGGFIFLEFAEDSDFDKEIIFTPTCTAYLKELGLHLSKEYISSLLYSRNISGFFRNTQPADKNALDLHEEILAMIGEKVTDYPLNRGDLLPLVDKMVANKSSVKQAQSEIGVTLGM